MGKKTSIHLTLAILFTIASFSLTSLGSSRALATQPTILTGYGFYDVDFTFAGLDFSGDRSLVMAFVEWSPEHHWGFARFNHEGRKMTADIKCFSDTYSEDGVSSGGASYEGFYSVAGIIKKVKGYTEDDIMFPKLFIPEAQNKSPEVGDWFVLGIKLGENGEPDQITFPFVFAPVSFGLPISCESLDTDGGPHGPPFGIIDLTYGDLTGKIKLKGL